MKWTEQAIIQAIKDWNEIRGEPPKIKDWRYAQPPHWPSAYTAVGKFGTWGRALQAAGFERGRGRPSTHPKVETKELVFLAAEVGVPADLLFPEPTDNYYRARSARTILEAAPQSPLRDLVYGILTGRSMD